MPCFGTSGLEAKVGGGVTVPKEHLGGDCGRQLPCYFCVCVGGDMKHPCVPGTGSERRDQNSLRGGVPAKDADVVDLAK